MLIVATVAYYMHTISVDIPYLSNDKLTDIDMYIVIEYYC